jgi:Flp pilus assembly protein TadG
MRDMAMQNLFTKKTAVAMWQTLRRFAGNRADGIAGVAAVEFAIIVPPLLLMVVCTADLGFGMYRKLQVQNAAQAGAEYAIAHGYKPSSISTAVKSATTFSSNIVATVPPSYCGCPSNTGVTTATCNFTCADGSLSGTYVTVSAQGSYTTLLPYPGIANTFDFASTSTVRIQ